jgi:chromosome segregation ATPase
MKEKDIDKVKKELKQAMDTIKAKEIENNKIKNEKDRLVEDIERKDLEIEELTIRLEKAQSHQPPSVVIKDNNEAKDLEIAALKQMIDDLKSSNNIPETFMAAEEAEIEMYNEKTKELFLQVAELQEENDRLSYEIGQLRQSNAAHKAQVKETVVIDKTKELSDQINELRIDNDRYIKELANARMEIKRLKEKLQGVEEEAKRQEKEKQEREEENKKHAEEMELLKRFHSDILHKKRNAIEKNHDIIEEIKVNFNMVLKKSRIMVPPGSFDMKKFIMLSENLTAKMCKK